MPHQRRFGALVFALATVLVGAAIAQDTSEPTDAPPGAAVGDAAGDSDVIDTLPEIRSAAPNILVVDFDWVIRQSNASQSIQSQLDTERQALQERFAELEAELRTMEQGLEAMGDDVPDAEQLARRREFEQLVADTQRAAQARRSILDQAFRDAMDQVRDATVRAIADIADGAEAEIVLNVNQTVIYSRDRNISEQALNDLNEQLPDVVVELPEQEQ